MGEPYIRLLEYIEQKELTQGSEPSQYLKEEKTTVIPLVAASERGIAQTRELAPWGCRACLAARPESYKSDR